MKNEFYFEGSIAKEILSSIKETPFNKEIIESWREVAVTENVSELYNTDNFVYE